MPFVSAATSRKAAKPQTNPQSKTLLLVSHRVTELTRAGYNPPPPIQHPAESIRVYGCLKEIQTQMVVKQSRANGRYRSGARARAAHERPLRFATADDGPNRRMLASGSALFS